MPQQASVSEIEQTCNECEGAGKRQGYISQDAINLAILDELADLDIERRQLYNLTVTADVLRRES